MVQASGWGPVVGDGEGLGQPAAELLAEKLPRGRRRRRRRVGATRLAELLLDRGLDFTDRRRRSTDLTKPGGYVVVAPLHRGCTLPAAKLAIVAEGDLTGRRRAHRQPRPRKRQGTGFFEDLKPGNYVVHYQHGVGTTRAWSSARSAASSATTCCWRTRAATSCTSRATRSTRCASTSAARRRRCTASAAPTSPRPRAGSARAVREIAQELVVLYQKRVNAAGPRVRPATRRGSTRWRTRFPFVETPDQRKAIDDVKVDMERPYPMDRLVCGDVGFGKTEVAIRAAFKAIQDGKQVAVLAPTTLLATQHGNTFADRFSGYPIRVEMLSRFLTNKEAKQVIDGLASGEVDCVIGTHRLLQDGVKFKDLGLLVVDEEQRFGVQDKEAMKKLKVNVDVLTLTRHADPAHAGDEPRRHPRPVAAADPAGRPPADPHLRRRVRRARRGRGDPPRAAPRGPGVLGAQPGADDSTGRRAAARAGARGAHRRRPRADGRGHARAGRRRLLGGPLRRARVHDDHRERHRHADGEHARRRARRPARPRPDAPAARARRAQRHRGPTPTCSTRATPG